MRSAHSQKNRPADPYNAHVRTNVPAPAAGISSASCTETRTSPACRWTACSASARRTAVSRSRPAPRRRCANPCSGSRRACTSIGAPTRPCACPRWCQRRTQLPHRVQLVCAVRNSTTFSVSRAPFDNAAPQRRAKTQIWDRGDRACGCRRQYAPCVLGACQYQPHTCTGAPILPKS